MFRSYEHQSRVMSEGHHPRHIRDIAHLFISRPRERSRRLTILVSGLDRECFPALHVSNLALAVRSAGATVGINEISGLVPGCGYFLSLPPAVYLPTKGRASEWVSALGGLRLSHDVTAPEPDPDVCFVHLPPLTRSHAISSALAETPRADACVVLWPSLPEARSEARSEAELSVADGMKALGRVRYSAGRFVLRLDHTVADHWEDLYPLGAVRGWRSTLSDRVPAVIRDPDSYLARSYLTAGEVLTARLAFGRKAFDGVRNRSDTRRPTAR